MSPAILTLPTPVRAQAARLSDKLQEKFEARLRCVQILTATPRSQLCATARQLAAELYPIHGQGFAPKTIMNLFRAYRKDGAEALLFGYSGNGLGEKPVEFIEHVRRRCEKNKRVASVEIDSIRSDWFSGTPLPGFGSWRDQWAAKFPAEPVPAACPVWFQPQGFSSATLRRMLPSKAAMTIARRGHFAAHGLMPQKRNDYSQLRALECVVFDDVKTDWLVSIPGYDRPCELWLLVAMDAGCAHILDWVALAAVPDDEGKRHELLKEHMRCLVGQMILKYGIPTEYPMMFKVENAKATLSAADAAALAMLAGEGRIVVDYTNMVSHKLPGGFSERHGSPWGPMKARLESFFSGFHNHGAALPGQTGSLQVLNKPAELESRIAEHKALMAEAESLPADLRDALVSTFLSYSEAIAAVVRLFGILGARTKHRLQGFEKVQLWRFPEDHAWRALDELRRYPRSEVVRALFDERMESPAERFDRLCRANPARTMVPEDALLPFLARTIKRVRHPAPYTIAWTEKGVEWIYRGELPELASGRGGPFMVKLLPGNVAVAYLYHADTGARIGDLYHLPAVPVLDAEAQKRALGELNHIRSLVEKPTMERHAPDRATEQTRRDNNAAIIASAKEGLAMRTAADNAVLRDSAPAPESERGRRNLDRQRALAQSAMATFRSP